MQDLNVWVKWHKQHPRFLCTILGFGVPSVVENFSGAVLVT